MKVVRLLKFPAALNGWCLVVRGWWLVGGGDMEECWNRKFKVRSLDEYRVSDGGMCNRYGEISRFQRQSPTAKGGECEGR